MAGAKAQQRHKQQQKPKPQKHSQHVYESDGDSDSEDGGNLAAIPLKSLEHGRVRDFIAELDQDQQKRPSKRTRAEREKNALEQQKKRSRQDKAEKIVWRKFDRANPLFEQYYKQLLGLDDTKWEALVASQKQPVAVHVRVNGNYKSLGEIVAGSLQCDFDIHDMTVKLVGGDEHLVTFAPVEWVGGNHVWKLTLDSKAFRKCQPLADLSNYFRTQCQLGTLLRQEPTTSIIPTFLNAQPGEMVLDLCGGGEHRAPIIAETLCNGKGVLVVNERDSNVAAAAVRSVNRTLAKSPEVVVTAHKPSDFPLPYDEASGAMATTGPFDRVICCAPCSGDGLVRKIPEKWRTWSPANAWKFHLSQLAVASKALALAKVGGHVLYATRSLNPIEDEAVVAELLRAGQRAYELVDLSEILPDLVRGQGIASWPVLDAEMNQVASWEEASTELKKSLRPSMWPPTGSEQEQMHLDRCVRLLPHQNDTYGLFIAVLKKVKQSSVAVAGPAALPPAAATSKEEKKRLKAAKKALGSYLVAEDKNFQSIAAFYGLSGELTRQHFMERGGFAKDKPVHYVSPAVTKFLQRTYKGRLHVHKAGVEVFRRHSNQYDLTDDGVRALLPFLQQRVLSQKLEDFSALMSSKEIWLKNAAEETSAILQEMGEGSFVVVLDDMEPAQTGDQDIVLLAALRHNSYSLTSNAGTIARVKVLLSELNVGEEEDDGYDSYEFED
ncbi:TPA: hypothetical protein N0F65_009909 [Lagenidium giganteum]|uniref:SAM-dependent MTase RsmB/NOP-type domain-containing protein n=1 Tax=Lagenidium giganteum TaxID=4803 RepID=A0AAV2YF31_9STRA|nr:TPA: hypothetical protein N0F65_009909 [Lagenidium giganteum]